MIRRACLNPYDVRESLNQAGFFGFAPERLEKGIREFLHSMDQYPLHYIMHLCHACEIIGYCSPEYSGAMSAFFQEVYFAIVRKFHLKPESYEEMNTGLYEDRISKNTVERDF